MKHLRLVVLALMLSVSIVLSNSVQAAMPASTPARAATNLLEDGTVTPAWPGALDMTFDPGDGANDFVFATAVQPDSQVLIGGQFTEVDGVTRNSIARLSAHGSLDSSFAADVTGGDYAGLTCLALQSDGKVVIGGAFTEVNDTARNNIARLTTAGALDTDFDPGAGVTGTDAYLDAVTLQPDGRPLIGGLFTGVGGMARNNIARLTKTGAPDASFDPGSGTNGEVAAIAIQPSDGRVLIGGWFTTANGSTHNRLARLSGNGSVDGTFNPDIDGPVLAIIVQPDNRILIGGAFTQVNGTARKGIARLDANGSLDTSFDPSGGADKEVDAIALQPDGRIVIGGKFASVGGAVRRRIARLNASGSLDTAFDPGDGASYTVYAVTLQPDGKILIGGGFQTVGGIPRNYIARLYGGNLVYLPLVVR